MPGIHPVSRCTTPVEAFFNETSLGTSTGFFYQEAGQNYLVTNWHVITGKHHITGTHLGKLGSHPYQVIIKILVDFHQCDAAKSSVDLARQQIYQGAFQ